MFFEFPQNLFTIFQHITYHHVVVVDVAKVGVVEPGDVQPTEDQRLLEEEKVEAVEGGQGHPDGGGPMAMEQQGGQTGGGQEFEATVDGQHHLGHGLAGPEG